MKILAMLYPDGRIMADSSFEDEGDVWRLVLGRHTPGVVDRARQRGYSVVQLTVSIETLDYANKEKQ
jgi:hypothetical protein